MRICIDAGHNNSGADTGALGIGGIREQDITFNIAKRLEKLLSDNNHQVFMTRNEIADNLGTTVSQSLRERVRISNENECDFFISIHCNSGTSAAMGTETLISGVGGLAEMYAKKIQSAITNELGTLDRGVRVDTEYLRSKLYVLHNTICPAVLIEAGFITNQIDADKLVNRADDFAAAIASAFAENGESPVFTDISGHWAQLHIEKLYNYGVVNGFGDGTFRPDQPVTRAEASAMVSNALSVLGK